MTKYIIALVFPWLSFFVRGKLVIGLLALAFPFVIMYLFRDYNHMPTFGPFFRVISFIISCLPNVWAIYSIYLGEKKEMTKRTSELN